MVSTRRLAERPASFDVPVQKAFQDRQRYARIGPRHFSGNPVGEAWLIARRRDRGDHARHCAREVGGERPHARLDRLAGEAAIEGGVGERVHAENEPASLAKSQTRLKRDRASHRMADQNNLIRRQRVDHGDDIGAERLD